MDLRQSILDAIEDLPENLRSSVRSGLSERGVLDAESVKAITDAADIEVGHLMIMLLPVAAAYAQETSSQLRGTVVDASGAGIEGAQVTILHV
ncbi:MAG: hypothetical protein ACPGJE_08020, partial [Wenzhouxiangellaceae bacterium]